MGSTVLVLTFRPELCALQDHLNDIMSNITAIVCGAIASNYRSVWWLDPSGAVLISLYIIRSWVIICWQQVRAWKYCAVHTSCQ